MLERLLIQDFQRIGKFVIKLAPVTTLVGDTGRGKSSVLRALRWIMLNAPGGTEYIGRWGDAPFSLVQLYCDGHSVGRKRGQTSGNLYRLDKREPDRAVGSSVPKRISDLFNVSEINFQQQIEPPFWFTHSASQVSRNLNSIINLGEIDDILSAAASRVRRHKVTLDVCTDRLVKAQSHTAETKWAVAASVRMTRIETLSNRRTKLIAQAATLIECRNGLAEAGNTIKTATLALTTANSALGLAERRQRLVRKGNDLQAIVTSYHALHNAATVALPDLTRISQLHTRRALLVKQQRELEALHLGLSGLEWEVKEWTDKIRHSENELAAVSTCPTCGRPTTHPSQLSTEISTPLSGFLTAEPKRPSNG